MKDSHLRLAGCWIVLAMAGLFWTVSQLDRTVFSDEPVGSEAATQERVFSGPQRGENTKPFEVLHVKDDELQELELLKNASDGTTLVCFVHRLSSDDRVLFGLGLVDFYATKHNDLASHFVLLNDDRNKLTTMLRGWSRGGYFKKSLVSLSVDGAEGPGYYGLNRNVAMTVLVVQDDRVVENLVFNAPNGRDLESIMGAVATALGEPKPTLADVQQELRAERQRKQEERMQASPVFKLAPNEQVGRIMFGLVNARGNRSLGAQRRSKQLLEWVGDDRQKMVVLRKYCQKILDGDFQLDRYSRDAIEKLASENKDAG